MQRSTARVLYCYRDTTILIKSNINLKHCPGIEFRLIPKLISWTGLKSDISDFVKLCSDYISAIWSQWSIVPLTQEKLIQMEKGTRSKKVFW